MAYEDFMIHLKSNYKGSIDIHLCDYVVASHHAGNQLMEPILEECKSYKVMNEDWKITPDMWWILNNELFK